MHHVRRLQNSAIVVIVISLSAIIGIVFVSCLKEDRSSSNALSTARNVSAPREVLGAGSCAGSGCHSSAVLGHEPWQSSFTVWSSRDRHAQAYRVLFKPLASRIVQALALHEEDQKLIPAHQNKACLGCHATAGSPNVSEAVGCESCHGAAGDWVVAHTRRDWITAGNTLGMVDLADPFACATQCSLCHVGGPPCEDGSLREVSHDLIAAGHPRLAFDLRSFKESEPPHWRDRFATAGENNFPQESDSPIDPVNEWALGRLGALRAYLDQMAMQSSASVVRSPLQSHAAGVWPEFTAFDCYGCHRLAISEFDHASAQPAQQASLGIPRLDPWHWSLLTVILAPNDGNALNDFRTTVEKEWWNRPDPKSLHACIATLESARSQVMMRMTKQSAGDLAKAVIESADLTNWAEAVAVYAALNALVDRSAKTTLSSELRANRNQQLELLRKLLEFSGSSTLPFDAPDGTTIDLPESDSADLQEPLPRFDSPHAFDAQAVENICDQIVALLETDT